MDEEHDPGEMEQVVGNEMASDIAGSIDCLDLRREEEAQISELESEEENPSGRWNSESVHIHFPRCCSTLD